ncbi:BMA-UNC-44, isoform h [Dirofilaria immitis]|nr:BMA-UNC-44, isoform h [Dirofilaria immitis]
MLPETVHAIEKDEAASVALPSEVVLCTESDSLDSLDKISTKSGSSGKKYSISRRSSTSSRKSSHDEPQTFVERFTPELQMLWVEKDQEVESTKQSSLSSSEEYPTYVSESGLVNPVEVELETVDEEPEEADSLNGRSISSNGQEQILALQLENTKRFQATMSLKQRDVLNKGESSLSGSEVELYVAGKLKTTDGSTSSLAEFERLEQEVVVESSPQDEVMILSDIREESEVEEMSIRDDDEEEHDSISDIKAIPVEEDTQAATPLASPADSIERDFENFVPEIMGTSIDSLEINVSSIHAQNDLDGESYLTEYEVIEKVHEEMHDSLEMIPQNKNYMLKGGSVLEVTCQNKQALMSGDTVSTCQEDQEEKDSLGGDMDTVLHDYPTTLTTFETMQINEDGSTEIISRRVLTRVTDPVISHIQFTGTENENRLRDLEREEEFETMDVEGNVTRTTLYRSAPSSSAGTSHSAHRG